MTLNAKLIKTTSRCFLNCPLPKSTFTLAYNNIPVKASPSAVNQRLSCLFNPVLRQLNFFFFSKHAQDVPIQGAQALTSSLGEVGCQFPRSLMCSLEYHPFLKVVILTIRHLFHSLYYIHNDFYFSLLLFFATLQAPDVGDCSSCCSIKNAIYLITHNFSEYLHLAQRTVLLL